MEKRCTERGVNGVRRLRVDAASRSMQEEGGLRRGWGWLSSGQSEIVCEPDENKNVESCCRGSSGEALLHTIASPYRHENDRYAGSSTARFHPPV